MDGRMARRTGEWGVAEVDEWTGWMDGWVGGDNWMDGRMARRMDEWGKRRRWVSGPDGWMETIGWTGGWADGRVKWVSGPDGWMDGRMDGWMDGKAVGEMEFLL